MGEGEGKAEGSARGENKGGQRDASGRRQPDAQRAAEQMRKPAEKQAGEATAAAPLPPQMGAPRRTRAPIVPRGGRLSPAGGTVAAAFVQRPQAGEGAEASKAEQRAPESAPVPPPPVWPPPSFPELRALCSRPGAGGATGQGCAAARAALGTYVSLWSSARRSFGTLRRWDSRLRSPSTVSSGDTDNS